MHEPSEAYTRNLTGENEALSSENTLSWNGSLETHGRWRGPTRREQKPLPCDLCNDHVDDRWLAAPVGFEAALQRVLEFFRIRYLLAVAANGFGDLHEVRRVDVRAVVNVGLRRDPVRIHLQVHALHRGVFLVVKDDRHDRQFVIARRAEAAERRVVQERAVADQGHNLPFRLPQLDPQAKGPTPVRDPPGG